MRAHHRFVLSVATLIVVILAFPVWSQSSSGQLSLEQMRVDVEKIVRDRLDQLQIIPHNVVVRITSPTNPISLPTEEVSTRLTMRDSRVPVGRVGFEMVVQSKGARATRHAIVADVEISREVLVAAHRLRTHQVIAHDDVLFQPVRISLHAGKYIVDSRRVIGQRATQPIQSGAPITSRLLDEPPMIQKKQRVTIVAEHGRIRILATGVATEDGHRGAIIKVMNVDSKQPILAQVTDASTVKINF